MAKDIVTLIKEMNRKTRSKLVSLLECREDIQKALDAGCSVRDIWLALSQTKRITYTYNGFRQAVNKHIRADAAKKNEPKKRTGDSVAHSAPAPSEPGKGYVVTRKPVAETASNASPQDDDADDGEINPAVQAGLAARKHKGHAFSPEGGYWGTNPNPNQDANKGKK